MPQKTTAQIVKEWFDEPPEEQARRNAAAIKVLDSFLEGDEEEQRETLKVLKKAMNDDRPGGRKLFPNAHSVRRRAARTSHKPKVRRRRTSVS